MSWIKRFKQWIWPRATDEEESLFIQLSQRGCPDCSNDSFEEGPEAGLAMNIRCSNINCHSEFNVAPMLHFAERINHVTED